MQRTILILVAMCLAVRVEAGTPPPRAACDAAKIKGIGVALKGGIKCLGSTFSDDGSSLGACLSVARDRVRSAYTATEARFLLKDGCTSIGDGPAIGDLVYDFLGDMQARLGPQSFDRSLCAAKKVQAVGKVLSKPLKTYGKVLSGKPRRGALAELTGVSALIATAFGKSEALPDCTTTGDGDEVGSQVTAFLNALFMAAGDCRAVSPAEFVQVSSGAWKRSLQNLLDQDFAVGDDALVCPSPLRITSTQQLRTATATLHHATTDESIRFLALPGNQLAFGVRSEPDGGFSLLNPDVTLRIGGSADVATAARGPGPIPARSIRPVRSTTN